MHECLQDSDGDFMEPETAADNRRRQTGGKQGKRVAAGTGAKRGGKAAAKAASKRKHNP